MQGIVYHKLDRGKVVERFYVKAIDASDIDRLLLAKNTAKAHGNSKAVAIWGPIDENAYAERMRSFGAKPIVDRMFPSSKAASRHLGYRTDEVGYAMRQAKRRGESIATVAGVPLRRADEIPD